MYKIAFVLSSNASLYNYDLLHQRVYLEDTHCLENLSAVIYVIYSDILTRRL